MSKKRINKIEVFKTNIQNTIQCREINENIFLMYPKLKIDFDLEDIDKVLRIEGLFSSNKIIRMVISKGYKCEILL